MPQIKPEDTLLEKVHATHDSFTQHIGDDIRAYVKSVYTKFVAEKNIESLADQTTALSKFQGLLYDYQNEILNVSGTGAAWIKTKTAVEDVCLALRWVEEVYCSALVDPEEVVTEYRKGRFSFQTEKI